MHELYKCKESATLATVIVLSLLLSFASVGVSAHRITKREDSPCAVVAPGPPTQLKIYPGTGKVRLTWNAPENEACVDKYVVEVTRNSGDGNRIFESWSRHKDTLARQATIDGLEDGVAYQFMVRAFSERFRGRNSEVSITASPRHVCQQRRPGRVKSVRATPGDGYVEVCWDGIDNDACVSEYRVRTRVKTEYYRYQYDKPEAISKGRCIRIEDLRNNVNYEFSVIGYHQRAGRGVPAYIDAAPRHRRSLSHVRRSYHERFDNSLNSIDTWKCHSVPNSYPRCEASNRGFCREMTCAEHAAAGNCNAPFMQDVDHETKTITQFCSGQCPCPLQPSDKSESKLRFSTNYCCKRLDISYRLRDAFK